MEHANGPMVAVPAAVAGDLLGIIGEARRLGAVVADLVTRAEVTLERFEGCLSEQLRSSDLAYGASAEAIGLPELYRALGAIADTANRI